MKKIEETKEYKDAVYEYMLIGKELASAMKKYNRDKDSETFKASLTDVWNKLHQTEWGFIFDEDEEDEEKLDYYGFRLVKNDCRDPFELETEWFEELLEKFTGHPENERPATFLKSSGSLLWSLIPENVMMEKSSYIIA